MRSHSYVAYDFALSPDGTRLAFTATSTSGTTTLWVKNLGTDANQRYTAEAQAVVSYRDKTKGGVLGSFDELKGAVDPA